MFRAGPVWRGLEAKLGRKTAKIRPKLESRFLFPIKIASKNLDVLKIIFNFVSWSPLPRGVPGEGPDCHFPKEIVGLGPIPAQIRGFLFLISAPSTAWIKTAVGGGALLQSFQTFTM